MIKKSLFVALAITGTIVGVGFASGREVMSFFARFGFSGLLACAAAAVLFSLLSFMVFNLEGGRAEIENQSLSLFAKTKNIGAGTNSRPAIDSPNIKSKFNKTGLEVRSTKNLARLSELTDKVFDLVLFVCQVAICSAMFAGIGTILTGVGLNRVSIILIELGLGVVLTLYLSRSTFGVYFLNSVLSIIIVFVVLIVFIWLIARGEYDRLLGETSVEAGVLPVLYVGMNIFTAYPLLRKLAGEIDRRERRMASIFIGVFIWILLSLVCLIMLLFGRGAVMSDMAMIEISRDLSLALGVVYTIIVGLCIATTLASTAYGAGQYIKRSGLVKFGLPLTISLLLGQIGFSKIIDKLYPLIGFSCLLVVIFKFASGRIICRKLAKTNQ